jgi:iron complex outermembrane recepter protein
MRTKVTLFRCLSCLICLIPALSFGADAALVTITGRVSNAGTQANLEGATVTLAGTSHTATTERDGTYRLQVPAGQHTLTVSYTGLDPQSVTVTASAGTTVRRDIELTSAIYQLDKFVVPGEREGNALAITLQRQAPNVKDVVSADAFGNAGGNPAEVLGRLPGIVADYGFEGRYVTVRGIDERLTAVTMDGNRMGNGASAGSSREFQFELIGMDRIERIEVTKSPTPDMDADSIAGVVNLVSKSAFDRSGERRIRYSAGLIWRPFYTAGGATQDTPRKNWTVSYSEVFKGKFGVSVDYGSRKSLLALDVSTQNHENKLEDPAFTYQYSYNDFKITRKRYGGGIKLDYKLSENTRFFATGQINYHVEYEDDNNSTYATNQTIAARDAAGNFTGTGGIVPGYTRDRTEWRAGAATTVTVSSVSTLKGGKTENFNLGAVHKYNGFSLDYDAFRSVGITDYPGNATFSYSVSGVGLILERRDRPYFPAIGQTAGPDIRDIRSYGNNQLNIAIMRGDDVYHGAAVNAKKEFATRAPTWIKAGLRWREQTRDLTQPSQRWNYAGPDGRLNSGDENLAEFLNLTPKTNGPVHLPFPARPFRDRAGTSYDYAGYNIGTLFRSRPDLFIEDIVNNVTNELNNRQNFEETINAGYLMGNVEFGTRRKLSVLGGVRVEQTKTWGEGALRAITPEERARRAAWVGPVTNDELRRRTAAEYSGRISASGDYTKFFPGVHVKYEPVRGLVGRLSYATNIGRPAIGNLIPRTTVDFDRQTISSSNPSLKPQYSRNYDATVEYYFEPAGRVSAAVFLKEITDFHFSTGGIVVGTGANNGFGGDYAGYTLTTRMNGGSAEVRGMELAYQQQFTFLPGWLKGFGAFANYTRLETEGDYGGTRVGNTSTITGFVPKAGNIGISYIRNPISIRVQLKHRGRFLNTYNDSPARLVWAVPQTVVDVKTVYNINRRLDLYMDAYNVTNAANRKFEWQGGRPQNTRKDSLMILFGINGRL